MASTSKKTVAGTRKRSTVNNGEVTKVIRELAIFETELGWFGLLGENRVLISNFVGHPTAKTVRLDAEKFGAIDRECDWAPSIRQLFQDYAQGKIVDFSQVPIQLPEATGFRRNVLHATRRLPYGETVSYGELARKVGHPRAARAVGTVMATNRFPILIPCHRVLASGGKIGGYTSRSGINFKERLLKLEGQR